jgi:riboflavin synthase
MEKSVAEPHVTSVARDPSIPGPVQVSGDLLFMFTGLVQAIGAIQRLESHGANTRLWIRRPREGFENLVAGESVAVNGVCLTVEAFDANAMSLFVSSETIERTAIRRYRAGDRLNLERAMALGDRLGGHLLTGHVDAVGRFLGAQPRGEDYWCRFEIPDPRWNAYMVEKGSIAIDGVSLTIASLDADATAGANRPARLAASIIPFTWRHTTLHELRPNDPVNLEFDLIGKYILRWLEARSQGAPSTPSTASIPSTASTPSTASGGVTLESLRKAGFL